MWWKLREVAVLAIGFLGTTYEPSPSTEAILPINDLITHVLAPDLHPNNENPFLKTRAIWCTTMIVAWPGAQNVMYNLIDLSEF